MRKFKHMVASITYYKEQNIILFLFFSLALVLLSSLAVLRQIQRIKMAKIMSRWEMIKGFLPNNSTLNMDGLLTTNQSLQAHYLVLTKLVVTGILFLLVILTGTLLYQREKDIKSLMSLGLPRRAVASQLLIETLFPIIFSFSLVLTLGFMFQPNYKELVLSLNDTLFMERLPNHADKKLLVTSEEELHATKTDVLLTFNENTFYHIDLDDIAFDSAQLLRVISRSFLSLLAISFSVVGTTSFWLVQRLSRDMHR